MAGDWLKVDVTLPDKPEVWQIAGITGIDPDAVVGKLLKVWRWFDAQTEDGNAHGVTYALVDHVSGVTGFGEAMALCGWLEQNDRTLTLPNFERHNGKTAKNRALTAKRVAACKAKVNGEGNGASVSGALPREEKRREEERAKPPNGGLSKADENPSAVEPAPCPHQEIVDAYHELLPSLRRVRDWTPERQAFLRARWREATERQSVDWWRKVFTYVGKSDFLMGRESGAGRRAFDCDLEWIVRPKNLVKILEGKYHRSAA